MSAGQGDFPGPGIYPDVPFQHYCLWPYMNCSVLTWASVSMQHVQAAMAGLITKKSADLELGRAIHTRVLEPEIYQDQYVIAGFCITPIKSPDSPKHGMPCGRQGKFYKDGQWFCGTHAPVGSYEPDDYLSMEKAARIECINAAVCNHSVVNLVRCHGGTEVSVVWEWEGITLKGRVDKDVATPKGIPPCVLDLKKVRVGRGSDEVFAKAIHEYHYDFKAAFYIDALKSIDGIQREFVWIVVEDNAPYSVNVIHADDETIRIGRYKYLRALHQLKECMDTGIWPGYTIDIHRGGLPEWARRQYKGLI